MIQRAIEELKEGGGLSERAISEFIVREYENLPLGHEDILRHHLGKLCQRGQLVCTVDRRYILWVDGGAAKKKGAVLVGWRSRKKRRGRRKEVSKSCGGEENQSMEREIGGKTEAQGMRINGIDEERKGEEEREEVLGMLDQRIEEEVSRPSGVEDRGGEIGEENQPMEREIEGGTEAQEMRIDGIDEEKENKTDEGQEEVLGKLAQGIEEKNEAVEEQSEAERQDMEVTEIISGKLNDGGGSNGEEMVHAFIKASENNEYIQAGEQQDERIKEQQLGISSEQNDPQPEQTEVIESRFHSEEVQKQQQPDKAESNNKTISTSPLNEVNVDAGAPQTDVIEEEQLEESSLQNEILPQQAELIEKQIQLEEVQKQHQQESCGQQDETKVKHDTISASTPTATTSLGGPSSDGQKVNLEKQSDIPAMQLFPKLKSTRKKKLFLRQKQKPDHCLIQQRKLRSYTRSHIPESDTSSTISELPPLSQQQDELQQQAQHEGQEKQHQRRPPKQKRDEKTNMKTDFNPHEERPLKRHRVQGRPPIPTPNGDKEASDVKVHNEQQQHKTQLQQRVLRSHTKAPSVSESAKPTMPKSSMPSKNQEMQKQQARRHGRPPRPKIDADTNAGSALSLASQEHKEEELPPKHHDQGSPPKPKTDTGPNAGSAVASASQHHEEDNQPPKQRGRGRSPVLKTATDLNAGSALSSALQDPKEHDEQPPKPRGPGRSHKRKADMEFNAESAVSSTSQHHDEEHEQSHKHRGRGRRPKPKTATDLNAGLALPLASRHHEEEHPPKPRLGRPPNPKPSKYMLRKHGKLHFPSRGRGRPRKEKQDAMILKSRSKSILRGQEGLLKQREDPRRVAIRWSSPGKMVEEGLGN
ncbi:trichohyalin isoform X2 [Morus notabilis]|nr:trichohyalin isoform X2 [Morus notabilis]